MTKLLVAMALASVVLAGNAQAGNKFDGLLHQVSNKSCEKACRDKVSSCKSKCGRSSAANVGQCKTNCNAAKRACYKTCN